jgi:hypothetical protein
LKIARPLDLDESRSWSWVVTAYQRAGLTTDILEMGSTFDEHEATYSSCTALRYSRRDTLYRRPSGRWMVNGRILVWKLMAGKCIITGFSPGPGHVLHTRKDITMAQSLLDILPNTLDNSKGWKTSSHSMSRALHLQLYRDFASPTIPIS